SESETHSKKPPQHKFHILTSDVTSTLEKTEAIFAPHRTSLGIALNRRIRRSPRRRSISVETDLTRFVTLFMTVSISSHFLAVILSAARPQNGDVCHRRSVPILKNRPLVLAHI